MRIRVWIAIMFLVLTNTVFGVGADIHEQVAPISTQDQAQDTARAQDTTRPQDATRPQDTTSPKVSSKALKILPSDVRVLIDISGSMKKTDPQNLRKSALDLIVRLLPDKSRAGVWIFGNDVNMLVPHNTVDANWRKQAAPNAEKINSIALYTNIGKALDEVSFDRKNLSPDYKTHIILLTDGVVDISKEAVDNIKERQRILTDVLPGLKNAGYIVHTIALSADADTDLLKKISVATDGVFTTAHSADELTSTFLKIFDQAVPAERVPLENNGFLVDDSVKEFTALIFRKPGVEKTVILAPDGKEYSATNPQEGINWYRTSQYDLITADTPKAGQWKIKTEITPQSRITVVSNLQLVMQSLKNNIHSNDSLALNYSFQENNKTVTNVDFLNLLETNVIIVKEGSKENTALTLEMPAPPADGIYHQSLSSFAEVGDYEVHVYVDGKTFKREFKHSLSVRDSLLTVNKSNSTTADGKITYSYKVSTDEKLVNLSKTKLTAAVKNSKNNNSDRELELIDGNHWEFAFSPEQTAEYHISFHALGEMVDGDEFDESVNAETFSYQEKAIQIKPPEPVAPTKVETPAPVKLPTSPPDVGSNKVLYIAIAVGNLLIIALGYFVYRMFFGGKVKDELAELEKTLTMDAKPGTAKVADKNSSGKMKINLNEEKPANIPMNDPTSMDTLFPLDDMEDET